MGNTYLCLKHGEGSKRLGAHTHPDCFRSGCSPPPQTFFHCDHPEYFSCLARALNRKLTLTFSTFRTFFYNSLSRNHSGCRDTARGSIVDCHLRKLRKNKSNSVNHQRLCYLYKALFRRGLSRFVNLQTWLGFYSIPGDRSWYCITHTISASHD